MSIHQGSCMFGNIDGNKGTGWDIAAISDKASDYAGGASSQEAECSPQPRTIQDGARTTCNYPLSLSEIMLAWQEEVFLRCLLMRPG